ncbi:MAG: 3-deoxy-manno-octulosonate cytidylyltransferase [Bacteroidota bacterium]
MKIIGIIPARYASTRFPGKPLASIMGKTMIKRVYYQCLKSIYLDNLIVATDDERIYNEVKSFRGNVIMTSTEHLNGTSRCAEAISKLPEKYDYVINIQGDEPLIHPEQIDTLGKIFFKDADIEIATLVKKETDVSLLENRHIVKAIVNKQFFAVDFKRELTTTENFLYKHIGIYGFQTNILQELVQLAPSENEIKYQLEQLRWLDNGYRIKAGLTEHESISVDVPEEVEKIEQVLKISNY